MCELSGKLMAWLDHELEADEMAHVQQHIHVCTQCQSQLDAYQQASSAFSTYRDAVVAAKSRRLPRCVPALSVATALATAAALFLSFYDTPVEPVLVPPPSVQGAVQGVPSAALLKKMPAPGKSIHRRRASSRGPTRVATLSPPEPAIEIALPVESMFPPGAVPEGISFTADIRIAADGSAQQIQLRPQMIGFERRSVQP
jgi:hypothetical protein